MTDSLPHRVKHLRERLGLTQSELARRLDVKPQAIQALEAGKVKRPRFIVPLAKELGVSPDFIETGTETPPATFRNVKVRGVVQAGAWSEVWEWDSDQWYDVPLPVEPGLASMNLFAVESRGPSMDKRYPEGTVLICSDVAQNGENVEVGKRYVVERTGMDGSVEATVKTLHRAADGELWLVPESNDPMFQEPIPLAGKDGETIRIVGRVRYAMSKE